jgi:hypothetical protein
LRAAQDGDVLRCEAKAARKLLIIERSEPRAYALLGRIVLSLNDPAHQARSGFQQPTCSYAFPRKLNSDDCLLIFLQGKRYRLSGRKFDSDGPAASANAPGSMLRARFRSREVGCREPVTHLNQYWRALFRRQRDHIPRCGRLASNRTVGEICVRNECSRESHRRRQSH